MNNYLINENRARKTFGQAASTYDNAAVLGHEVEQRLLEHFDLIRLEPKRILDLGCATGHLTQLLANRYPEAELYGVDHALGMVSYAAKKNTLPFLCADAQKLPFPDRSVDLIISNLMLHWCNDLEAILKEWRRVLSPEGLLMFSVWGPDTLKELRESWAQVDDEAYTHVHAFWDMHDIGDTLVKTQFADPVLDSEYITVTYKEVSGLMQDLRHMGAGNATEGRRKSLIGKQRFQRFLAAYETYRNTDHVLPVTYEVIYGHAWAPAGAKNASGDVHIPIQHIARRSTLR